MLNISVSRHLIGLVAGISLAGAASCSPTRSNEGHCAVREGDAFCADKYGDERRFCARGTSECELDAEDGCVAARPVDDACYSPCGGGTSIEEDADCEGIAETGTDATTLTTSMSDTTPTDTTEDPTVSSMSASSTETESETEVTSETDPTTGPVGCMSSEECTDAANPVCVDEVCSPCTAATDGDAACEEKNAGAPACRDDGECVQCTPSNPSACGDVTPICGEASACVGCTEHEQCAAGACELDTGACFDEGCTVEVNPGDDIEEEALDGCVLHIHAGAYAQSVTLSGVKVALLGAGDGDAIIGGELGNSTPSLRVLAGATVYVEGLLINGNDGGGLGVEVNDALVWMDRTQVVANTGGGIALSNGADAAVRNCFVGGNVINDVAALDIDGATADILYSTLIAADQFGDGAALRCVANEAPSIRNSVLAMIGAPSEIQCASANITYSASETLQPGTGNVMLPSVMPAWFDSLTDDFHLDMPPAAIATAAEWQAGDPAVDIDGEPRPDVVGTVDVAGADVPQ